MKQVQYKSYDELPLMLSVPDIVIGNQIIVPKDEFISWIKRQTAGKSENFQ